MADQNPLAKLLGSFLPPKADGPRVPRPLVDPHPTKGKEAFATGMDLLLGGLGLRDPLAEDATGATGLGSLLGMIGPAGAARAGRGLFSRVDEAAKLIPKGGAHPSKVMSLLKNNASGEELAWRGVPEFVQGQGERVTPEALAAHLAAKPAPMPTKKILQSRSKLQQEQDRIAYTGGELPGSSDPKYAAYQVPGGTNYRETLSTLPEQPDLKPTEMVVQVFGAFPKQFNSVADANDYIAQITAAARQEPGLQAALNRFPLTVGENVKNHAVPHPSTYRSPHFDDTPNVLVHTRSNERTLPTGEPGRLIENVQSDWHQAGRKQGYAVTPDQAAVDQARKDVAALLERRVALEREGRFAESNALDAEHIRLGRILSNRQDRGVPDAPFKDSWPELGLKQEVLDAVNRDAEWIGITPAATLNTRGEAISEAFQDQRLPLTLEKILKPFGGGRVERGAVNAGNTPPIVPTYMGDGHMGFSPREMPPIASAYPRTVSGSEDLFNFADEISKQPHLSNRTTDAFIARLTPEMRAAIKEKGLPLLMLLMGLQAGQGQPLDKGAAPVKR